MSSDDGYGMDLAAFSLDALRHRLAGEQLLPSHRVLRDELDPRLDALAALGLATVQQLVDALTTPKAVERVAAQTGIPVEWLTILRRHVRGYIPAPVVIAEIPELPGDLVATLAAAGIKDTRQLFGRARTRAARAALAAALAIDPAALAELMQLTDLARVGWIGPIGVRWFAAAGINSAAALAAADADELCAALAAANSRHAYTRVTLGRNDAALAIAAAQRLAPVIEF